MAKPKPVWVEPLMKRFGETGFGGTRYRIVWSEERTETRFGEPKTRYGENLNRWLLEKFLPWSEYGEWNEEAFGPKPSGGEYDLCYTLEIEGQYVSLEDFGANTLELLVRCIERSKLLGTGERVRAAKERERKADEAWRKKFSDWYDDGVQKDRAVSGIPDKRKPEDVQLYTPEDLPENVRTQLATVPGKIRQIN